VPRLDRGALDHFYQEIPGWCDYADYYAKVIAGLPDGARIVEVGAWQGQSTAALGVEIANSGKAIRLDVVDHFRGSDASEGPTGALGLPDLRQRFDRHTEPIRHLIRNVHQMASVDAAALYDDASLDFVWIDASHTAPDVLADLNAWWPKVRRGGILAGHDADMVGVSAAVVPWGHMAGVTPRPVSLRSWEVRKPSGLGSLHVPVGRRKCLVVVASNERTIYRGTVESLVKLGWGARVTTAGTMHGFDDVQFTWVSRHTRVDDLRNEAVRMAIGTGATHLLFLDADMTWPSDLLARILAHHDKGVVSGLYFLKQWPHWPVSLASPSVNLSTGGVDYIYDDAAVIDVHLRPASLVGMGCTLIPMSVIDAMPSPWFEYRQNSHGFWTVTEDVAFCQKVSALGCPIWLDPSIKCGHIGAEPVTEPWFLRSQVEQRALADMKQREQVSA